MKLRAYVFGVYLLLYSYAFRGPSRGTTRSGVKKRPVKLKDPRDPRYPAKRHLLGASTCCTLSMHACRRISASSSPPRFQHHHHIDIIAQACAPERGEPILH
ncbi:hypothetical protein CONPUDRAFT_83371 [Coniophora puteana RWD-64-598 SS2]|uniref:Secreted protein n=1 Tax=Coniophora puteana (strain RWD-64-598) TaxID=741705 RepID=A0A5M3MJ35_CONPW|nr:uncharacterized protein CONPUDRAFT_83371 [Coniophora puteana RWD-64-598 SS2]EIW78997.1 hypothetical protein CONPUDRAFT_83371 [Coniophora puteana RWD-64-598 SS2]